MNETDRHRRVELTQLGDGAWRACDAVAAESDPLRVVAFLERRGTRIEVVWLRGSTRSRVFDDLDQALDAVCAVLTAAESRSTRPTPIPHLPPRLARSAG